jgi:hypothetical protein
VTPTECWSFLGKPVSSTIQATTGPGFCIAKAWQPRQSAFAILRVSWPQYSDQLNDRDNYPSPSAHSFQPREASIRDQPLYRLRLRWLAYPETLIRFHRRLGTAVPRGSRIGKAA